MSEALNGEGSNENERGVGGDGFTHAERVIERDGHIFVKRAMERDGFSVNEQDKPIVSNIIQERDNLMDSNTM